MEPPYDPETILRNTVQLRQLARTLVRDSHLADDLVQEAWLAAVRRPPEQSGALKAWLGKVVRNLATSQHRRDTARRRREIRRAQDEATDVNPEAALERFEVLKGVVDLVTELEEPGRSVIILHFFEGRTLGEIAERQGVAYATARFRLKGALMRLREHLDRRFGAAVWSAALASLLAPGDLAMAQATVAGAATPGISTAEFTGGILAMSAKKLTLCAAASLAILLGVAGFWWTLGRSWRLEPGAGRGERIAVNADGRARPLEVRAPAEPAAARPEEPAAAAIPLAVQGRVTSQGEGLPAARVIALALEGWNLIARNQPEAPDREARLRDLDEAYRRHAASAPAAVSGDDGTFAFRGLEPGEYRLLVSHPKHLPSVETLVAVASGAVARPQIELVPGAVITGVVQDEAGQPVAGAALEAENAEAAALKGPARDLRRALDWEEGWTLIAGNRTASRDDGSFRFSSLAPTFHAVRASHPDYLEGEAQMAAPGSRTVLTLKAGAVITGRILDAAGRPIAGASASLASVPLTEVHRLFDWTGSEQEAFGAQRRTAASGDDGRFRLAGVRGSFHELTLAGAGFAPSFHEVEAGADPVDLGDLVLVSALEISGTVSGPDGRSLAGARVWAGRPRRTVAPSNQIIPELPPAVAETRSDAQGRFALAGLPPGDFVVRAEAEGLADAIRDQVAAGTRDLALALEAGITVHGKVLAAATRAPVPAAEVKIGLGRQRTAVSDEHGAFIIRGLSTEQVYYGNAAVRATHPDFGTHSAHSVMVLGRSVEAPLEILLVPAAHDLEGEVKDARGRPVANALVWLESAGDETGFASPKDRTATGADGRFRLEEPDWLRHNFSRLQVTVLASHPGHAPARVGPLEMPETGTPWPLLEIALGDGAVLTGRVLGEGQRPLAGARVTVRSAPPEGTRVRETGALLAARTAYTTRDGSYRLRGLEPAPADVVAAAPGHAPQVVKAVALAAGAEARQDFALERGRSIRGRVLDTAGAPLEAVEVTAIDGSETPGDGGDSEFARRIEERTLAGLASARTDREGRYELADLPGGVYTVIARASGYESSAARGLEAGGPAPDLALARFSAIRGSVLAAAGVRPLPAFTVNVIDRAKRRKGDGSDWREGSQGELAFRDPLGRFLYDGLRPGEYEVIVVARGFLAHHADVKLGAGEDLLFEARLEPGLRIEGRVLDAETGLPVGAVEVSCYRQAPPEEGPPEKRRRRGPPMQPPSGMGNARSGADGAFVIDGLLPGEYAVWGLHPFYSRQTVKDRLESGQVLRLDLRLRPTGRVEGTLSGLKPGGGAKGRVQHSVELKRIGRRPDDYKSHDEWGVGVDDSGRFQAQDLEPGTYRLVLKIREYRLGSFRETGPGSGQRDLEPVGPEEAIELGEVTVRARETVGFAGGVRRG